MPVPAANSPSPSPAGPTCLRPTHPDGLRPSANRHPRAPTPQRSPAVATSPSGGGDKLDLSCTLDRSQAGATRSAEATADALCRFGHDGDWFENLGTYLRAWLHPGSFAVALQPPELNKTYITANIRSVTDRFQELTATGQDTGT